MFTRWIPFSLIICFALSACTEDMMQMSFAGGQKTQEERALETQFRNLDQQTRNIVSRNTIQGAVAGALILGGLTAILGGDSGDIATAAAAGAAIGGVAGNQVGQQTAQKNEEIVKQKQIVADLKGVNDRLSTAQTALRRVISNQNSEIASLRRQLANQQISQSQYDRRISAINSNRTNIINGLARAEENVSSGRKELVQLEAEHNVRLTSSKNAASSTRSRLANVRNSIRLVAQ